MYHEALETIQQFYDTHPNGVIIIRGATATGKTALSVRLAEDFPVEVISADSRQIYRSMDIATDKISPDIRAHIPHYQIDIIDPDERYSAGQWQSDTIDHIGSILHRGHKPFVVGGTGLYIDTIYKNFAMPDVPADYSLRDEREADELQIPGILWKRLNAIDPDEAAKHPPENTRFLIRALEIYEKTGQTKTTLSQPQPPRRPILMLGLWRERDDTNRRINRRIREMFAEGLVQETQGLLESGYSPTLQSMGGIGYREVIGYLQGDYSLEKAEELMRRRTHRLAKKQRTRFRRYIADSHTEQEDIVHHVIHL